MSRLIKYAIVWFVVFVVAGSWMRENLSLVASDLWAGIGAYALLGFVVWYIAGGLILGIVRPFWDAFGRKSFVESAEHSWPATVTARRPRREAVPAGLRFDVFQRDGFRCRYCGRSSQHDGVKLHADHIMPVASGGATTLDNLVTSCQDCNLGKSDKVIL